MPCKLCHEHCPPKRKDGYCSDYCFKMDGTIMSSYWKIIVTTEDCPHRYLKKGWYYCLIDENKAPRCKASICPIAYKKVGGDA